MILNSKNYTEQHSPNIVLREKHRLTCYKEEKIDFGISVHLKKTKEENRKKNQNKRQMGEIFMINEK
jgi:hypothetical protein